jgi:hypothetical protein
MPRDDGTRSVCSAKYPGQVKLLGDSLAEVHVAWRCGPHQFRGNFVVPAGITSSRPQGFYMSVPITANAARVNAHDSRDHLTA